MVYGKYNTKITNENSKLSPIGPYGKTKLRAEELINSEILAGSINCTIFVLD